MPSRSITTQQVADIFDVDLRTVQKWVKDGCPCDPAKTRKQSHDFNAGEVAAWMRDNNRTGLKGRPHPEEPDDLKAVKLRKERALAERYERENAVDAGLLIDAAAEQQRDVAKITAVRNRLCGLGASLAPQMDGLDGSERQSLIDSAITAILEEFSKG